MTPVVLLRSAQADIRKAAQFYESEAPGLGTEFLDEIDHALRLLSERPKIGAPLRLGARKYVVRRFPYLIIHRLEPEPERVLVLAVGHQRRHPDFWLGRR